MSLSPAPVGRQAHGLSSPVLQVCLGGVALSCVAAGVSGVFLESHPDPENALSDGPNSWPLDKMRELLQQLSEIDSAVKSAPWPEDDL